MMRGWRWLVLGLGLLAGWGLTSAEIHAQSTLCPTPTQLGDTWIALQFRTNLPISELQAGADYRPLNAQWQPPIGATLSLPCEVAETGLVTRPSGTLFALASQQTQSPWALALQANRTSPFHPNLHAPILAPDERPALELPSGFDSLALAPQPLQPGQAYGLRATTAEMPIHVALNTNPLDSFAVDSAEANWIALGSTGAFFPPSQPELQVISAEGLAWSQPLTLVAGSWNFEEVVYTGAADSDREAILQERERLFEIWNVASAVPQWQAAWREPIVNYLYKSSPYGARRSVNGGPYATYHEGVDYAAYGGTPVYAPAAGTVVLAELLDVRGGSVIVDHGWGIYSGVYHLSTIDTSVGSAVAAGDLLGTVGTTGRSTGNHLHWDLLVNGRWVDGDAWLTHDLACWLALCRTEVPNQ